MGRVFQVDGAARAKAWRERSKEDIHKLQVQCHHDECAMRVTHEGSVEEREVGYRTEPGQKPFPYKEESGIGLVK